MSIQFHNLLVKPKGTKFISSNPYQLIAQHAWLQHKSILLHPAEMYNKNNITSQSNTRAFNLLEQYVPANMFTPIILHVSVEPKILHNVHFTCNLGFFSKPCKRAEFA